MSPKIKKTLIIAAAVCVVIGMLSLWFGSTYVSYYDYSADSENDLAAMQRNLTTIKATHYTKVREVIQIPQEYADRVQSTFIEGISRRSGPEGNQAMFQMLQEAVPNLPPEMWMRVQLIMESGRNEIANQELLISDAVNVYQKNIDRFWSGMWIKAVGYPKIDLAKIKPVSTVEVESERNTGLMEPIKLR